MVNHDKSSQVASIDTDVDISNIYTYTHLGLTHEFRKGRRLT